MTCIYLKNTTQVEIFWLSSQSHHSGHFGWLWKRECDCLEQQGRPPTVDFKHSRLLSPNVPNWTADYDWQKVTFFMHKFSIKFSYCQLHSSDTGLLSIQRFTLLPVFNALWWMVRWWWLSYYLYDFFFCFFCMFVCAFASSPH